MIITKINYKRSSQIFSIITNQTWYSGFMTQSQTLLTNHLR